MTQDFLQTFEITLAFLLPLGIGFITMYKAKTFTYIHKYHSLLNNYEKRIFQISKQKMKRVFLLDYQLV